jgi:hypothetical protein
VAVAVRKKSEIFSKKYLHFAVYSVLLGWNVIKFEGIMVNGIIDNKLGSVSCTLKAFHTGLFLYGLWALWQVCNRTNLPLGPVLIRG